jgi:hypothetical protein
LFDGVGWKVFFKIVTVMRDVGLGHILDLDQAASARIADEKVFKEEDAQVQKFLLEKLSKRLAREARGFKTATEMINWLRNEYGQDLTHNQQAELCEPQKADQCGHCMVQCDRKHARECKGRCKGGVIYAREHAGKCKGRHKGGKTHARMHENQTNQNF